MKSLCRRHQALEFSDSAEDEDVGINHAFGQKNVAASDLFDQLIGREHLTGVEKKSTKELEFHCREIHFFITA